MTFMTTGRARRVTHRETRLGSESRAAQITTGVERVSIRDAERVPSGLRLRSVPCAVDRLLCLCLLCSACGLYVLCCVCRDDHRHHHVGVCQS